MRKQNFERKCDQCGKVHKSESYDGNMGPGPGDFCGWFTVKWDGRDRYDFCEASCFLKHYQENTYPISFTIDVAT